MDCLRKDVEYGGPKEVEKFITKKPSLVLFPTKRVDQKAEKVKYNKMIKEAETRFSGKKSLTEDEEEFEVNKSVLLVILDRKGNKIVDYINKSLQLGFDEPICFDNLKKARDRHSHVQQKAWEKLVQAVADTKGQPNIVRLKAGHDGSIDLDELGPGEGAWVTPKRGPAAGRHVLVVKRPDGDFALIGGLHKPNTRIDADTKVEYLVDKNGNDIQEATPEDYLSNLSHRHFAFKAKGKPLHEPEAEKERRKEWEQFAKKKAEVSKEYKGATKKARELVSTHQKKLRDVLGLEEGTTLTPQAEQNVRDSFENAARSSLRKSGVSGGDENSEKLIKEFSKKATSSFKRERNKRKEVIQEILLDAATKGRNGKDIGSNISKIRQTAKQFKISALPAQELLMTALNAMHEGNEDAANQALTEAGNLAALAGFDHAEQKALEEISVPDMENISEVGTLPSGGSSQEDIDLVDRDPDAIKVDTGFNLAKTISKFKSNEEGKKVKEKVQVPVYSQVDAEPEFSTNIEKKAFFNEIKEAQKEFAASRIAANRAKEKIKELSEEAAGSGLDERPRTHVSPEEFAVSLQDVETAMASTGVSPEDIAKEMALLEMAQNTTSPTGPGMYTVINEFWNDKSGNLLDPYMRRGSEYALAGMLGEHLPKEILASPEVSDLLGKLTSAVKFNPTTKQFEAPVSKSGKAQYGGLVSRTSASVAPVIAAQRLAQLAIRGEVERKRIKELEKREKEGVLSVNERVSIAKELKRLHSSPFSSNFGKKDFEKVIKSVSDWNKSNLLKIEDEAMKEDSHLRNQVEVIEKQYKTKELLSPEEKIGIPDINPRSKLGKAIQRIESLESLRKRRQENLGMALGSLETSAALLVALSEARVKSQWAAAGVMRVPEEGAIGKEFEQVSSPIIAPSGMTRISIPGQVEDPNPEKQNSLRQLGKISAYDYVRNQLGFSDSEIHEVDGSALAVPKNKLATIGVDKGGVHVLLKLGGPQTLEDSESEALGVTKKQKARGLLDKIKKISVQQSAED